jgi:hypothetical protein
VAAYLGRYRDLTRQHSESDLRAFLRWCTDHELDPLAAVRIDVERYVRWLQDVRCYQSRCGPSKPAARTSPTSAKSTATASCACAAKAGRI